MAREDCKVTEERDLMLSLIEVLILWKQDRLFSLVMHCTWKRSQGEGEYESTCLNKDAFTPEEDDIIVKLVEKGLGWASIAQKLGNGRTPNAIKNAWN
ncbi:3013_t:CDS:2, partial [Acaulospora colombiana]